MTKKYANEILSWTPIASEGYVYLDELSLDQTLNEATLRYAKLDNGTLPAKGTLIQTRAQFRYATLLPTLPAVVYEVSSNAGSDGLYINASLPFTTTPVVPPPDAGTPDATTTPDAPARRTRARRWYPGRRRRPLTPRPEARGPRPVRFSLRYRAGAWAAYRARPGSDIMENGVSPLTRPCRGFVRRSAADARRR
jgi:hypothetical protein